MNEKNTVIAQLTQQTNDDAQVLSEKNTEINRLETGEIPLSFLVVNRLSNINQLRNQSGNFILVTELKLLLSGHVGYKKTEKPQIKVEKHTEEDQVPDIIFCYIFFFHISMLFGI